MRSQRERVGCRSAGLWASALQPNTSVWQRVHVEFIGQRSLMLLLLKGAGQMSERLSPSIPPAWFRHIVKPFPDGTGDLSSSPFQATLKNWGGEYLCVLKNISRETSVQWSEYWAHIYLVSYFLDVYALCMKIVLRVYVGVLFLNEGCARSELSSWLGGMPVRRPCELTIHCAISEFMQHKFMWHNMIYPSRTWINIRFDIPGTLFLSTMHSLKGTVHPNIKMVIIYSSCCWSNAVAFFLTTIIYYYLFIYLCVYFLNVLLTLGVALTNRLVD